jgi:hypothetical protein
MHGAFSILSPEFLGVHLARTKPDEDWNRGQHQSSEPAYWNSEETLQVRNICTPPLQQYNRPRLNRTLPSCVEIGEMSAASDKPSPQMAQGQVWRIDDAYLHIVEIGRRMIYYKMTRQAGERTLATQMIGIDALAAYLRATEATLMS